MPALRIKPVAPKQATTKARFERRFVNGVWTVFNRHTFDHGAPFTTLKEADRILDALNAGRIAWAS
jgi:hypothetical protein